VGLILAGSLPSNFPKPLTAEAAAPLVFLAGAAETRIVPPTLSAVPTTEFNRTPFALETPESPPTP
jgi:hypothetical protein